MCVAVFYFKVYNRLMMFFSIKEVLPVCETRSTTFEYKLCSDFKTSSYSLGTICPHLQGLNV